MEVSAANPSPYNTNSGRSSTHSNNMELGTDTFLKLLVTQMRYQDPFSGSQDMGEFMTQLAQFTLLERVIKLQQILESYAAAQAPVQALNLLNKVVEVTDESGQAVRGEVTAVRFRQGMPLLKINDREYTLEAVTWVQGAPAEEGEQENRIG